MGTTIRLRWEPCESYTADHECEREQNGNGDGLYGDRGTVGQFGKHGRGV